MRNHWLIVFLFLHLTGLMCTRDKSINPNQPDALLIQILFNGPNYEGDFYEGFLPATEYAVFTLKGKQISSDWHLEIDQWISKAGYQGAHPFSFQYYDERFKGLDKIGESQLDVYMPVTKAAS